LARYPDRCCGSNQRSRSRANVGSALTTAEIDIAVQAPTLRVAGPRLQSESWAYDWRRAGEERWPKSWRGRSHC